jgi:hypothetical protein
MASPPDDEAGLSIDMLDVDRLRGWAHNILTHGGDISHWASTKFVASKLETIAACMEVAIQDIGTLRRERATYAQYCADGDPVVMAADAAKAACIRRLQRAISDTERLNMLPLTADECVGILERMTWQDEIPTACPQCHGVGVVAGDDPTCLACLGSGKAPAAP